LLEQTNVFGEYASLRGRIPDNEAGFAIHELNVWLQLLDEFKKEGNCKVQDWKGVIEKNYTGLLIGLLKGECWINKSWNYPHGKYRDTHIKLIKFLKERNCLSEDFMRELTTDFNQCTCKLWGENHPKI